MKDYIIMTDSSCDLPAKIADDLGLKVIPLIVNMDGHEYHNYLDERELSFSEFYAAMRRGAAVSTSAPSVDAFMRGMIEEVRKGADVLYVGFSAALSCTYQNACIAAGEVMEQMPGSRVWCIDSKCASLGQGMLLRLAVEKKRHGASIEELRDYIESEKNRICHWFTVDDLKYLHRGGRITGSTAAVGTLLHIKPVMHMDNAGKLVAVSKARGRKAALKAVAEKIALTSYEIDKQTIFISHGDCMDDVKYLEDLIRERAKPIDIITNHVGPVIGAHSGPGTISVFFVGVER